MVLYFCTVEEKEKEIILAASEVFMRLGIKSVNMDDISRQLGISKKTLYKYVSDKNDLVKKVVQTLMDMEDEAILEIQSKNLNAIEENLEIMKYIVGMLNNLHPSVMFDMEKYHPTVMKDMVDHRHSAIMTCILSNLERGVVEGYYRENLDTNIISQIYIHSTDAILDQSKINSSKLDFSERFKEFFRYHIRGIASEKGIAYLKEKYKNK